MADSSWSIAMVLLAQSGDRDAMNRLLSEVQADLYRYLVQLAGDKHLAEDILQDVFVLIWRKLRWLRTPEVFRPWVYRISSREAFRRLKKQRVETRKLGKKTDLAAIPADEIHSLPLEWAESLSALLDSLPPASRAVLILHYVHGMTLNEVADVLEISPGTVKSRLAYGLATLRQKIRPDGSSPSTPAVSPSTYPPEGSFR